LLKNTLLASSGMRIIRFVVERRGDIASSYATIIGKLPVRTKPQGAADRYTLVFE